MLMLLTSIILNTIFKINLYVKIVCASLKTKTDAVTIGFCCSCKR